MEELAKLFTDININQREKLGLEYKVVMKLKENIDNKEYINRVFIISVVLLVLKENRVKDSILEELTKLLDLYSDITKDVYKIKYVAFLLIKEVVFYKKMSFQLLLLVINRLEGIPTDDKNLKIYKLLRGLFLRIKKRWELSYLYIGDYPSDLSDFEKIILVVINFFQKKKRVKRIEDFIWLKLALGKIDLNLKKRITFKQFYEYLLDNLEILNLLFRYISKEKLANISSFESSLIVGISIVTFAKSKNKKIILNQISRYFRENYFSAIDQEINLLDFGVSLIINLSLVWNFNIEDKDNSAEIDEKIGISQNLEDNFFNESWNLNKDKENRGRLLIEAIENNNLRLIKELLDMRIDLNYRDNNNRTPLIYAVKFDNLELVDRLIELGADLNLRDNKGRTALIEAVIADNAKVAFRLIKAHCDTNVRYLGKTPLELAIDWNRRNIIPLLDD
ncbi:ankyrin repeat protein [Orenia metallireducens]|uniref:ankyrin repeat domain-containing protein n=1 Tax=Orenia metallireducens TaxID=1413210 RepID=UPI000D048612|nr:ankyrin repeat domain-containing protein [Orenia metallireducens]PRX32606.1 ankyrin repeat protein [Orenia metallireducens]